MGRASRRKREKGREGHGSKMAEWYAAWTDEHCQMKVLGTKITTKPKGPFASHA